MYHVRTALCLIGKYPIKSKFQANHFSSEIVDVEMKKMLTAALQMWLLKATLLANYPTHIVANPVQIRQSVAHKHDQARKDVIISSYVQGHCIQPISATLQSTNSSMDVFPSTHCSRPTITVTRTIGMQSGTLTSATTASSVPTSALWSTFTPNYQNLSTTSSTATSISYPDTSPALCPNTPINKTNMSSIFGFNVVNTKPTIQQGGSQPWKEPVDWNTTFALLRRHFPSINTVRLYSTTDSDSTRAGGEVSHLENALPAAKSQRLSILAGIWSGGLNHTDRFEAELSALKKVIQQHGCENIAAVSVGNEDINDVNMLGLPESDAWIRKTETADLLVSQITDVRSMLRSLGCCTPVTHTETWNELMDTTLPWTQKLYSNVDQAMIANIFPWWGNVTIANSWNMLAWQANQTNAAAQIFNKEIWLGETGWPLIDNGQHSQYPVTQTSAQQYFNVVGCQILRGTGSAFYYVDWDQDAIALNQPSFGIFDVDGNPLLDLSCTRFKPDTRIDLRWPKWLGGLM